METLDLKKTKDIFAEFALSSEEMMDVRGGDGIPPTPPNPPIKI